MPRTLTGSLHPSNRGAIDWSTHGLLAYGCHSTVVIVDPDSVEVIQVLERHKSAVTQVCWAPENFPHGLKTNFHGHVRLVSADLGGQLFVWDVPVGDVHCSFSDGNHVATDIRWLPWQDTSKDLLLALHPPSSLILWNADTGEQIWTKTYTERLQTFSLDPFSVRKLAFVTVAGRLLLVDDFNANKSPAKNGQLFRISGGIDDSSDSFVETNSKTSRGTRARMIARPFMQAFRVATGSSSDEHQMDSNSSMSPTCNPIIQLAHHGAVRHLLLIVYTHQVLFMDTESLQTIAHVQLKKHASPFIMILPCSLRDSVYFVQDNGCITFRIQRLRSENQNLESNLNVYNPCEVFYEGVCMSESARVTKTYRLSSACLCPVSQRTVVVVMSSGRLLLYNLTRADIYSMTSYQGSWSLSDLVSFDDTLETRLDGLLKLPLAGLLTSLGPSPTVVRMRPMDVLPGDDLDPLMQKNLAVVGTKEGIVYLIDVESGRIERDIQVHSCPIRCLEWGGPFRVITAGHFQTLSTSTVVRNDVMATDIRTGQTKVLRPEVDESPIESLRVSFYLCYLALAFHKQPLEIWDLKSFRLLRRMSKSCPIIVDMAWSGKHHTAKPLNNDNDDDMYKINKAIYRENLVVLDTESHLYHVVVKGMHVRDGKEVNTQWSMASQVSAMVWKDDFLAFGDIDGRVSIWDLHAKQSRTSNNRRGGVVRLQFSHLAGDHTLAVLHNDGLTLWDSIKFVTLANLSHSSDLSASILDLDMNGSNPMFISSDNCLRFCADLLKFDSSPITESTRNCITIFCPSLCPPLVSTIIRTLLNDKRNFDKINDSTSLIESVENLAIDSEILHSVIGQVNALENNVLNSVLAEDSIPDRAVQTAEILGDTWELHFWTIVATLLGKKKRGLDPKLELFWNTDNYKRRQLHRASVFDSRRANSDQVDGQVEMLIVLGQLDSAIQLLLDHQANDPIEESHSNSLKACLLSADHSSTGCQSTVKLVATNLIAGGRISEGIQLLFVIGKGLDACRYLQSYGFWERSICLAKMALNEQECSEVLKKWADHLSGPHGGQKTHSFHNPAIPIIHSVPPCLLQTLALLLLTSIGHWSRVVSMLLVLRQPNIASLLLDVLDQTSLADQIDQSLREAVFSEYAKHLHCMGAIEVALELCDKAGQMGANLKKEILLFVSDQ